ncbi:MAG: hypothetical protein IIZ94_07060 [Prevotella sp.]|nr:hypothetical protein [Prevotella sp.]
MDLQTITSLIGSLGFPIAACCYMAYFSNKTMKEFKDSMEANTSVLRELTIYVNQLREGFKNDEH